MLANATLEIGRRQVGEKTFAVVKLEKVPITAFNWGDNCELTGRPGHRGNRTE